MYSFLDLEPVCCSMSSSNYCFLTCIQISQETGQVVWYSQIFKNFPQFVVIHRVKYFSVVNEAEVDVFLEFSCFFYDPKDVGNLISGFTAFSTSSLNIRKFLVFCHKCGVIGISEVIDTSPGSLDSSLCFIQPGISHDVLCVEVK